MDSVLCEGSIKHSKECNGEELPHSRSPPSPVIDENGKLFSFFSPRTRKKGGKSSSRVEKGIMQVNKFIIVIYFRWNKKREREISSAPKGELFFHMAQKMHFSEKNKKRNFLLHENVSIIEG